MDVFNNPEPTVIVAGDTSKFTVSFDNKTSSQGYQLTLRLSGASTGSWTGSANSNGIDFDVVIPAAGSATLSPGLYTTAYYLTLNGERYTVKTGHMTVLPDPTKTTNGSSVSDVETLFNSVEAAIKARLDPTNLTEAYSIASRSWTGVPLKQLMIYRAQFARELNRLKYRGNNLGSVIPVQFNPVK
jgi:hypothetical protein